MLDIYAPAWGGVLRLVISIGLLSYPYTHLVFYMYLVPSLILIIKKFLSRVYISQQVHFLGLSFTLNSQKRMFPPSASRGWCDRDSLRACRLHTPLLCSRLAPWILRWPSAGKWLMHFQAEWHNSVAVDGTAGGEDSFVLVFWVHLDLFTPNRHLWSWGVHGLLLHWPFGLC